MQFGEKSSWMHQPRAHSTSDALSASQIAFCVCEYAAALALDVPQFNRDTSEDRYAAQVGEDCLSGVRREVNRTLMCCSNRARGDGTIAIDSVVAAIEDVAKENKP